MDSLPNIILSCHNQFQGTRRNNHLESKPPIVSLPQRTIIYVLHGLLPNVIVLKIPLFRLPVVVIEHIHIGTKSLLANTAVRYTVWRVRYPSNHIPAFVANNVFGSNSMWKDSGTRTKGWFDSLPSGHWKRKQLP